MQSYKSARIRLAPFLSKAHYLKREGCFRIEGPPLSTIIATSKQRQQQERTHGTTMLVSRRRAREMHAEEPPALRHRARSDHLIDETWFLRDLLDAYDGSGAAHAPEDDPSRLARHQMLEFLRRRNHVPQESHDALDTSLQVRCECAQ